jgi:Uma2 family endonuclease
MRDAGMERKSAGGGPMAMHQLLHEDDGEVLVSEYVEREARYHGMRLTAEEYYELEDDGCRYELIDGVVCMTPSPIRKHGLVSSEIAVQLGIYLKKYPVGEFAKDIDVLLGKGPRGGDLIYRPDIMFFRSGRVPDDAERYELVPDLVVEVASVSTRRFDRETKKADYERLGVSEYWIIDPRRKTMTFYRLEQGRYVEVLPDSDGFASTAVPGFTLDLAEVRKTFKPVSRAS